MINNEFGNVPAVSFATLVLSQKCLRARNRESSDFEDPPFTDEDAPGLPASPAVQAIIPTYKFSCDCVNITSWETYVQHNLPGVETFSYSD